MFWSRKKTVEAEPVMKTPALTLCDVLYPKPCGNAATGPAIHGWKTCDDHKPEGARR